MNKVKILLSVIIIMSVIGGVFAFKATKRTTQFCTISMVNNACPQNRFCDVLVVGKITTGPANVCYTTIFTVDCKNVLCPVPVRTIPE